MGRDWGRTVTLESEAVARVSAAMAIGHLTVIRGSDHDLGRYLVVGTSATIGRGEDTDLSLHDHGVSRRHARIVRGGDGVHLLGDLGSTNGTWVRGQRVGDDLPLRDGDKIFIGQTVLRFALADDLDLGYQTEVAQILGTDPLTGLESKRRFDDALDFALGAAQQSGQSLSLFMMDMDGVKGINDRYGHAFGAHVIGEAGRIIARELGPRGHACRFGGDEFCAFLAGHDADAAFATAESIRTAVERAGMSKNGIPLAPTLSVGIATTAAEPEAASALMDRADAALYRAKAAGKNRTAR